MKTTLFLILLLLAFFGLVFFSVHREEQREADRRLEDLPFVVERRQQERRAKSLRPYLTWAIRTLWSKLLKRMP